MWSIEVDKTAYLPISRAMLNVVMILLSVALPPKELLVCFGAACYLVFLQFLGVL